MIENNFVYVFNEMDAPYMNSSLDNLNCNSKVYCFYFIKGGNVKTSRQAAGYPVTPTLLSEWIMLFMQAEARPEMVCAH